MRRLPIILCSLWVALGAAAASQPVDLVSTLVGTLSKHSLSTGNTYPAIAMPWGMNFWTPQTGKMGDGWQYVYTADKIRGLKQTHQPSPWINDYGQFAIMATTGRPVFDEDKRASWFSHKAETATPYYYKVYLADWDVVAEVTPTDRAAVVRFTFPATSQANIVVDAFDGGSSVSVDEARRTIAGYSVKNSGGVPRNFRNYFVVECDHDFTVSRQVSGPRQGAVVTLPTRRGEQVTLRVASSFVSLEQALLNLKEVEGRSFEAVCQQGRQRWNEVLGRVEVADQNIDHLRTFYSCLYRSVLFPRMFYEIDASGKPIHYSPHTGEVRPGYYFTDTGFWDTFRCLFPLLNLLYPEMNAKMQEGLVNCYKESGFLPEWASPGHRGCMVGNNSASVVADAYLKGVQVEDVELLWQAVVHGANAVHPNVSSTGRLGFDYYNKLGYVPYNVGINENVARTLEYAYDDWCIYQLGKALGKGESELRPFREHALNYQNVFDRESRLMRGRLKDGRFQSPFSPLKWGDAFTEGNAWHYTWSVFLLVHLDDLAVISHQAVDLDLDVGGLGIDSGGATLLDELLELLGEIGIFSQNLITALVLDISPVLVGLPEVALNREADATILTQHIDHGLVPHPESGIRVMVVVQDVSDTLFPVSTGRLVDKTGGIGLLREGNDILGVELAPGLVERHPDGDALELLELVQDLSPLLVIIGLGLGGCRPVFTFSIIIHAPSLAHGEGRHVLPHDHSELVAVIIPAVGLDLDVLADHVEAEILGLLNIKLESLIGRGGVKPVGPPSLVEGAKLEDSIAVQTHKKGVAVLPVGGDFPHRSVSCHPVDYLSGTKYLNIKSINIRRLRRPEFGVPDVEGHCTSRNRHP